MLLSWWDSQLPGQIELHKVSGENMTFLNKSCGGCHLITQTENAVIAL